MGAGTQAYQVLTCGATFTLYYFPVDNETTILHVTNPSSAAIIAS